MATSRITIYVKNILQGGTTCKNPTIVAHMGEGLVQTCPIVDNKIEVQLDGQEAGYCFDLVIDCEDCEACPPQVKRICLCDEQNDCSECEACINGICTPICPEDEFCDNGICKDCLVDGDCQCNKECINGSCDCPPDKPFEVNGCCYECEEGDTEGCEICVGGRFVPKDCGAFLLNPISCNCEQCLDSGDCTEPNTCCVDGVCGCCPGYYYDPVAGGCLPVPSCFDGNDCPDCFTCVNGLCQELTCPAGYVRTGIAGNCCAKECDCNDPQCPEGGACVEYANGSCYCKPCSGACTSNADCGEGCGCYNGQCAPKPKGCDGACYNANDCAFGCGCLDGECVDCETLGCNNNDDCIRAEGCDCINGNCGKSDCDSPCIDADDCSYGCGCKNNDCIPCASVPCVNDSHCPEGCNCNGGICTPNPCAEVYCITPGDCGEGCGCDKGMCKPCSTLSCASGKCDEVDGCICNGSLCEDDTDDDDCDDDLRIEKLSDCRLKGVLDLEGCCGCPDISLHITTATVGTNLTVTGQLRKGLTVGSPLLSATGIANELPVSGSVNFVARQDEIEVDGGGAPTGITRSTSQTSLENYAGVDTNNNVFTITPIGSTYTDLGKTWKVIHICVAIEHVSTLTFENECTYKFPNREMRCDTNGSAITELTKLVMCKTPLFTWSESSDGIAYTPFRLVYSTRVNATSYKDEIGEPEGIEVCKYYKLETDCGCDRDTFYSCNGDEAPATKLVFCQPTDITVTATNCNQDIEIAEVQVCDAMIGAEYDLYLNGVLEGTYTVDGDGLLFTGGLVINHTEPVFEVKLVFKCDECAECTIIKAIPLLEDPCGCSGTVLSVAVNAASACSTGISYTITGGTANYTATLKKGVTTIFTTSHATNGVKTYNNTLANGTYTLTIVDAFGCEKTAGFIVSSCCQITVTGLSYDCTTKTISGTINDLNASGTYIVEVGTNPSFNEGTGAFTEVMDLLDGTYSVKVTDSVAGGCFWIGSLNVGCGGLELDITVGCDLVDYTKGIVTLENPSGGTGPYLAEFYAGTPSVTVDANGCPTNPGQLRTSTLAYPFTTGSSNYNSNWKGLVKLTDVLGRTRCFDQFTFIDCAENGFSFTTRMYCLGTTKYICFTPNTAGVYTMTINGGAAFADSFIAGQEKCYTTTLAAGVYPVTMTNVSAVTINKNVVVVDCNAYSVTYDCADGLTILENGLPWTGNIKVDGTPVSGYWSYTGPNTVFLADTTPDHSINLYSGTSLVHSTMVSNINCCELTLTNLAFVCDTLTSQGSITFDIVNIINPTGLHSIIIKQGLTIIQTHTNIPTGTFQSDPLPNGNYSIELIDDEYIVPTIGVGAYSECIVTRNIFVNCEAACEIDDVQAFVSGEIDCASNPFSNPPGQYQWAISMYNYETFTVAYQVYRKNNANVGVCNAYDTNVCSLVGLTLIGSGNIVASGDACLTTITNNDATACFIVRFSDPSDPTCFKCVKAL